MNKNVNDRLSIRAESAERDIWNCYMCSNGCGPVSPGINVTRQTTQFGEASRDQRSHRSARDSWVGTRALKGCQLQLQFSPVPTNLATVKCRQCFVRISSAKENYFKLLKPISERIYDLVVRVPGYRSRGLGFDSRRYQNF
jgi:hypothetical protein